MYGICLLKPFLLAPFVLTLQIMWNEIICLFDTTERKISLNSVVNESPSAKNHNNHVLSICNKSSCLISMLHFFPLKTQRIFLSVKVFTFTYVQIYTKFFISLDLFFLPFIFTNVYFSSLFCMIGNECTLFPLLIPFFCVCILVFTTSNVIVNEFQMQNQQFFHLLSFISECTYNHHVYIHVFHLYSLS